MKAIIGAHNCLTAYSPTKWWMRLCQPFWRCQRKRIDALIAEGVRFFDIRVVWDWRRREWVGAHGMARMNASVWPALCAINDSASQPIVRLILEDGEAYERKLFSRLCKQAEAMFPAVKFIGGNFKPTWEKLYDFEGDDIGDNICQMVGSMDPKRKWFGAVWPWLYAKLYNKRHLAEIEDNKFYLFDYL